MKLPVTVGEKGCFWAVVTVHGTPGHGSQPYGADNALVKAAEVVRRLAEHDVPAEVTDTWRQFVDGLELPREVAEPLLDPTRIADVLGTLPIGMARQFHACTHTTMSTNLVRGGQKINTIPDAVELEIDVRGLPGLGPRRGRGDAHRRDRLRPDRRRDPRDPPPRSGHPVAVGHAAVGHARPHHQGVLRGQRDHPDAHGRRHRRTALPSRRARRPTASAGSVGG